VVAGPIDHRVTVTHLDVFVRSPGGGNPCPIVTDGDGLTSAQMQSIAAHFEQETGFVLRDDDGGLRFRFFVPRHEMAMCVHATVAAVSVLAAAGAIEGGELVVRTASGPCRVTWDDAPSPAVTVEQQAPAFGVAAPIARRIATALRLRAGAVDERLPIRPVSVSRAKLIVPLREAADVHAADPDLDALWDVCRELDTTGAYVFAPHPDGRPDHVVARQFPVDAGFPEDPATGVAAGALAAYLADAARPSSPAWVDVEIDQGDAMGRPSIVQASAFADPEGVYRSTVTGRASVRATEEFVVAPSPDESPDAAELR
jgi:PhzF family phenazine biosynthesis protein